jgi:hypothetical protein
MTAPLEIKQYMLVLTPNRGEWEIKHNTYRVYKEVDNIYELLYTNDEQYKLATPEENQRTSNWFKWATGEWSSNFIIKGYDNLNELLEENAELFI